MDIRIAKVNQDSDVISVEFTCEFGRCVGIWHGDEVLPLSHVHVEIDVDDVVSLQRCSSTLGYRIESARDVIRLTALIETIQQEILCLRFGNSILQVECEPHSYFKPGEWIQIEAKEVHIYPFNL